MDLMARRGMLLGMAQGSNVIKGQFSANSVGDYTISFGKTLPGRYIVYFEMTEASKNAFAQVVTTNRQYGALFITWGDCNSFNEKEAHYNVRYNGTNASLNAISDNYYCIMNNDSIVMTVQDVGSYAATLYPNYTYDYMIIPIE